jgi:hypothetical protein
MYRSPLPHTFKWTKDDNSKNKDEVKALENEYQFRYIEAVGSLNYLATLQPKNCLQYAKHVNT